MRFRAPAAWTGQHSGEAARGKPDEARHSLHRNRNRRTKAPDGPAQFPPRHLFDPHIHPARGPA